MARADKTDIMIYPDSEMLLRILKRQGWLCISFKTYDNIEDRYWFDLECQAHGITKKVAAIKEHYYLSK